MYLLTQSQHYAYLPTKQNQYLLTTKHNGHLPTPQQNEYLLTPQNNEYLLTIYGQNAHLPQKLTKGVSPQINTQRKNPHLSPPWSHRVTPQHSTQ